MKLSQKMRRLIERNTGFTVPQAAGDPPGSLTVGTVIDIRHPERPTIGHLGKAPFEVTIGSKSTTGELDIDLGLSRLVSAMVDLDGAISPNAEVAVGLKLTYQRDVALSVVPIEGEQLDNLLLIAGAVAKHPRWNHARFAFVYRTYSVSKARMHIAKKGGGSITLKGKARSVSRAITGQFDAGVTWETNNVLTEAIDKPGVLGVHCARVLRNGSLKFV